MRSWWTKSSRRGSVPGRGIARRAGLIGTGVLLGAIATWLLVPRVEVVDAAGYLPVPRVLAECGAWVVQETAPDIYWDVPGTETQTSTADYWTVETLQDGVRVASDSAGRGATLTVQPSDNGFVSILWWDSDRPGNPRMLSRVAAAVDSRDC